MKWKGQELPKERPANVPRKTKHSLDWSLFILASLKNKLERMDEFFDEWGEAFQGQDWRDIRVGLADIQTLLTFARQGLWPPDGGTEPLGRLNTNDKHRNTPTD